MPYFVYMILTKHKDKFISYVGYTNNLDKRLFLHNSSKGAKFTKGKKWEIIFYKKYLSKSNAMKGEYKLKKDYKLRKTIKANFLKK
ncbi:GIY-YIG nuclease family protein [Candidatus Pelagibacter sp.]|nr:GIY-YIG nuclease family protein [Candidatus Pelagibacter sp.]|tara:strand:- start:437 stop:694 length:258 start_codon:yes stop_codon:yes gene_type:complete